MYNIFFDDDEEKKDVEVKVDENPIVSEDVDRTFSDVKDEFKEAIEKAKGALVKAKEEIVKEFNDPESQEVVVAPDVDPTLETDKEFGERMKKESEEKSTTLEDFDDGLKALDDESEDDDPLFKKL